jgi:hypothetical protein
MFELLIAVSAAVLGGALVIITFVAWAVRREDACLSMAEEAPGPITRSVRRLLGLHVMGVAGPVRPAYYSGRHPDRLGPARRPHVSRQTVDWPPDWPAHHGDRQSRPAYWNDPSWDRPAEGTGGREDRPTYPLDPPDDWPPDPARPRRRAPLPAGPRH